MSGLRIVPVLEACGRSAHLLRPWCGGRPDRRAPRKTHLHQRQGRLLPDRRRRTAVLSGEGIPNPGPRPTARNGAGAAMPVQSTQHQCLTSVWMRLSRKQGKPARTKWEGGAGLPVDAQHGLLVKQAPESLGDERAAPAGNRSAMPLSDISLRWMFCEYSGKTSLFDMKPGRTQVLQRGQTPAADLRPNQIVGPANALSPLKRNSYGAFEISERA